MRRIDWPMMLYVIAGFVVAASILLYGMADAQQPPSEAEQLRLRLVEVLNGPLCLGRVVSGVARYTTIAHARECDQAVRDAMASLVLVPPGPGDPPPPGTAAEVTCRYTLGELAPPQCQAVVPQP